MRQKDAYVSTALKSGLVDIDELVLIEPAVDYEVEQRNWHNEGLHEAVHQTKQQRHACVRYLPPVINILILPQPGFGPFRRCQPRLDVQQDQTCKS